MLVTWMMLLGIGGPVLCTAPLRTSGTLTPSGDPAIPLPVSVVSCVTAVNAVGAAIVSVLPEGVIVMFEPASRVTLSVKLFNEVTTWPVAIFESVTALSAS